MASLLRMKDFDGNPKITNSQIVRIDSYHPPQDIDYKDEADSLYAFLKAVCSKELFEEIEHRFQSD